MSFVDQSTEGGSFPTQQSESRESIVAELCADILEWYRGGTSDEPIATIADLVAHEAIENKSIGLRELQSLLTNNECVKILGTRVSGLIDTAFSYAGAGISDLDQALSEDDIIVLHDRIHRYLPELRTGGTVEGFLKTLRADAYFGVPERTAGVRNYLQNEGSAYIINGLLDAATHASREAYRRNLTQGAAAKDSLNAHASALFDNEKQKNADIGHTLREVAIDLLKARVPYRQVLEALRSAVVADGDEDDGTGAVLSNLEPRVLEAFQILHNELRNRYADEILEWYSIVGPRTSIVEMVELIAEEAIEDGAIGLHELQALLTEPQAARLLSERVKDVIDEEFGHYTGRSQAQYTVHEIATDECAAIAEAISVFVYRLVKKQSTIAQFLHELIEKACFPKSGTDSISLPSLQTMIGHDGHPLFLRGLIDAVRKTAVRVYNEKIVRQNDVGALRRYVFFLVSKVIQDAGDRKTAVAKAMCDLIDIGVTYPYEIDRVLMNANGTLPPDQRAIIEAIRDGLVAEMEAIYSADVAAVIAELPPDDPVFKQPAAPPAQSGLAVPHPGASGHKSKLRKK